jgi:GNAT superfamily N-acetyltransferase
MLSEKSRFANPQESKNKDCSNCLKPIGMIIHSVLNEQKSDYVEICQRCYNKKVIIEICFVYLTKNSAQIGLFDKKHKKGFINYGIERDRIGKIYDAYICKNYRNKGYLKEILPYLINDLKKKDCNKIVLNSATNIIPIWNKIGFKEVECPENSHNFFNMELDVSRISIDDSLMLTIATTKEGYYLLNTYEE